MLQTRRILGSLWLLAMLAGAAGGGCADRHVSPEPDHNAAARFPAVRIEHVFRPEGESNVRASISLGDGVALFGTEETGDIFRTADGGRTWTKSIDGGDRWGIQDVRNFIRAEDTRIYATTSEPALVLRSADKGRSWTNVARAPASRTVALKQLRSGTFLVGLRRSENQRISIIRSTDRFESFDVVVLDNQLPRQNTTCLIEIGPADDTRASDGDAGVILCGVGFEASGKVYRSTDDGLTWTQTAEFPDARDLMNFFTVGDRVFVLASGIATIYASDDAGLTWREHAQLWERGSLGQHATLERDGRTYHLLSATDQRERPVRHVVMISDDGGDTWHEWIELGTNPTGGASNLAVIDDRTVVVGTGNHSVEARAFTLVVGEPGDERSAADARLPLHRAGAGHALR